MTQLTGPGVATLAARVLAVFGLSGWFLLYAWLSWVSFVVFAPCMSLLL